MVFAVAVSILAVLLVGVDLMLRGEVRRLEDLSLVVGMMPGVVVARQKIVERLFKLESQEEEEEEEV